MTKVVQLKDGDGYKYIKTHADAIDGIDGKLVRAFGNESIAGTKNFQDGLQSKGKNVQIQNGVNYKGYYTEQASIQSGSIYFERYGDWVTCFVNFQVRSSGDLVRDNNVLGVIEAEYLPSKSEVFFMVGSESNSATVKITGTTLKAHSTLGKNGWFIGTVTYLAKNKL